MSEVREKLVGLLDYVEQVVRLDERIAFQLSDYRLPEGTTETSDDPKQGLLSAITPPGEALLVGRKGRKLNLTRARASGGRY